MATLKAGRYYIGDLFYIFDESWDEIINISNHFKNDGFIFEGVSMYAHKAKYGPGEYKDNLDRVYLIDSGILGIVPIESIEIDKKMNLKNIEHMGKIIDFPEDFYAGENNGKFQFGNIIIDAIYDEDDESYDDDYNDYSYNNYDEDDDYYEDYYEEWDDNDY